MIFSRCSMLLFFYWSFVLLSVVFIYIFLAKYVGIDTELVMHYMLTVSSFIDVWVNVL